MAVGARHGVPPRRRRPPPRQSRLAPWLIGTAVVVGAAAGYWLQGDDEEPRKAHKVFIAEMKRALAGRDAVSYSFGGTIEVEMIQGRKIAIARRVPQAICVEAGWELVRMGTISVNGVMPQKVSAGKLADLCSREPGGATVEWTPKK
jgi:hypothetical protein